MRRLNNLFKEKLQSFFIYFDIRITRSTSQKNIDDFISKIQPYKTEHELIRLGPNGDGGYLVPNDLDGISAVFSPGVSNIIGFELEFLNKGIYCFLSDNSVENPFNGHPKVHFTKKHISYINTDSTITLDDWVDCAEINVLRGDNEKSGDYILQMDIEGHEYLSLLSTSIETLSKFRIIVVEFHSLDSIADPFGFDVIFSTIEKLTRDFTVVHIHPNNCRRNYTIKGRTINPLLEITFLRKDRHSISNRVENLPHILDFDNVFDGFNVSLDNRIL
jgi:hypothetical protein